VACGKCREIQWIHHRCIMGAR